MDSRRADELDNDDRGVNKRNTKSSGLPTAEDLLKPSDSLVSSVEESSFNDLFWDQIIKYAATAMIVLTLLDLLSSIREDTVQCMTPTNYTRDQGAFINSYCSQFTPPTVYFPFFLVGQATIIYGLHFLWFSWFSGKFHYFLSLATSLDRCRESKTGSYSLRNFVLSRALFGCFEGSKTIILFYILKLLLQLLLSGIFIYFSFEVEIFGNYSPPFVCPRSDNKIPETWPIGGYRVPCVLTSLNLLVAVRWLNVILLSGICFSALYGFVWCLWEHKSRLNWVLVADFSFLSGLPPYMYVPKGYKQFWKSWGQFCQYRIKDDFHFLLLKLYREDAGHAQVLREVLIDNFIRKREQRQFERLNLWKNLGKLSLGNQITFNLYIHWHVVYVDASLPCMSKQCTSQRIYVYRTHTAEYLHSIVQVDLCTVQIPTSHSVCMCTGCRNLQYALSPTTLCLASCMCSPMLIHMYIP